MRTEGVRPEKSTVHLRTDMNTNADTERQMEREEARMHRTKRLRHQNRMSERERESSREPKRDNERTILPFAQTPCYLLENRDPGKNISIIVNPNRQNPQRLALNSRPVNHEGPEQHSGFTGISRPPALKALAFSFRRALGQP